MILVSIGTGIGSGIVINDSVYRGCVGGAGEIGEFVTDWSTESKMTAGFGRLEQWFSGFALESFLAGKTAGIQRKGPIREDGLR